jgi:hypothetical protein
MVILSIFEMKQFVGTSGGLLMEIVRKWCKKDVTNHNEDYWKMFVEDRVTQRLLRRFNKSYFDLIDEFMHIKLCFNPQHS